VVRIKNSQIATSSLKQWSLVHSQIKNESLRLLRSMQ
jgi:hypothetical protein